MATRLNISVPDKLKAQMDALGRKVNWSKIASMAFREELTMDYICLLLSTSYGEKGIPEVNRQLTKWGCGDTLRRIDTRGGPMPIGTALWTVVVRNAGQGRILKALKAVKWTHPPVQAMFKGLDGIVWESFTVPSAGDNW